jgi:oxygen-independent coproporphyrinogen-3 oxidase
MIVESPQLLSPPLTMPAEPVEGNYFVAAYPPFSMWREELVPAAYETLDRHRAGQRERPFGLYVHVPFCAHRCQYCYYLSYAGRRRGEMDEYVDALVQELAICYGTPAFDRRKLAFVYFGGGTPSLLSTRSTRRLMTDLKVLFPWTDVEEVTFECAPRSVTRRKMRALRELGVNRVSLGVQQLNDEVLRLNGRVHRVADVERAYAAIQSVGFDEVNLDLIVGLVGETDESFRDSLEQALRMEPDSITIYQLEVPPNTPLFRSLKNGRLDSELPAWETKHARLAAAFARLENAGYTLRSAYAAARSTRHRRFTYQEEQYRGMDLLGIGVSSFSYVAGMHYQNYASMIEYMESLDDGRLPISRAYVLSDRDRMVREFVLQLKLGRVDARRFRQKFGTNIVDFYARPLEEFAARGWLTFDDQAVTVTREGLVRVDRMIPHFYPWEHQGLNYW